MSKIKLYQNKQWLKEHADNGYWYGKIADLADVTANTLVKYMVEFGIYTKIPSIIQKAADEKQNKSGAFSCIILPGHPAIKKNSNPTRNGMRLPNKNYVPYADYNIAYLNKLGKETNFGTISSPVTLQFLFYRRDRRTVDISNLYEAPQDVMVRGGILADDNSSIVVSHHSDSRVLVDKSYPRTEIYFHRPSHVNF